MFLYIQVLTNILIRNIWIKVLLRHMIMQSETFVLVMLLEIPVFSKRQKEANKDLMQERFCTWPYITLTFDLKIWFHITAHTLPIISLRWYGTPCNIFKDDRILKNDHNHGFKYFKIYNICPKNAFIKFHKREKVKPVHDSNPRPTDY